MKSIKELVLVDGSGYIFRAYYALPSMTRSDGTPVNAVFGFCNMLLKLLEEVQREKGGNVGVAVIFDAARKTFRNEIYKNYKANRSEAPEDLVPQFDLIKKIPIVFNIPSIEHMWLHAIYNWQYNDNGFDYNKFSLRTFLDVIFLEPKNVYDGLRLHPAISHYYSLCSVLTGDYQNSSRLHSFFFKYQMLFPIFQSLFFLTVKFKLGLSFVLDRLSLFLSSKLYRDRLFQNPKIITKRILSIWDRS